MTVRQENTTAAVSEPLGVMLEVCYGDDEHESMRKRITITGDEVGIVTELLNEISRYASRVKLSALRGAISAAEIGFAGQADIRTKPCFCAADEWCSHNLPKEPNKG